MTTTPDVAIATPVTARKWLPLVIVALAQLMIALPSAQQALHISDANRQLVITAYTLAFGGLALTYYFQLVLHFSPVRAGLAFLPMTAAVMASSTGIVGRLLPRVPPRALIAPGLLAAAAALAWLTQLHPDSAYLTHALPAEVLAGLGVGLAFVPVFSIATQGVAPRDTGIASAMVNTANQVGGSIGTAVLNTITASATAGYLATHAGAPQPRPGPSPMLNCSPADPPSDSPQGGPLCPHRPLPSWWPPTKARRSCSSVSGSSTRS